MTFFGVNFMILIAVLLTVQILWSWGVVTPDKKQLSNHNPNFGWFNVVVITCVLACVLLIAIFWGGEKKKEKKKD